MSPGAFDIDEPQALLFDPDNPDGDWLHLVLLRRVQGAEWVCLKPDFSLEIFDLPIRDVTSGQSDDDFFIPGTLLRLDVDPEHPLGYGMPEETDRKSVV